MVPNGNTIRRRDDDLNHDDDDDDDDEILLNLILKEFVTRRLANISYLLFFKSFKEASFVFIEDFHGRMCSKTMHHGSIYE